jgi:hypothetical protein
MFVNCQSYCKARTIGFLLVIDMLQQQSPLSCCRAIL